MPTFKTKKAARLAGFRASRELTYVAPRRDAEPTIVGGEPFFAPDQVEELISETEARRRGLTVPPDAPVERSLTARFRKTVHYAAYRVSDCTPARRRTERPPQAIDLLAAIFAVNRSAKRFRDAAQRHYAEGNHGFAGAASRKKRELYDLKDRGIAQALQENRLTLVRMHAGLALYTGEGYWFHSMIVRNGELLPGDSAGENVFVDAKPREATEPRLKDAVYTLAALPEIGDRFHRLAQPSHERPADELRPQPYAAPNCLDDEGEDFRWDDHGE